MKTAKSALMQVVLAVFFSLSCIIPITLHAKTDLPDDLFSLSFPNEKDGWACGRWGIVLHTSDGGKTWAFQDSGTDHTLMSVSFVDANYGWAVGDGGIILHTEDGGKTWEKQQSPVPYYHMDVCFVDRLRGWIVSERTHILSTDDGGKTWHVQFKDEDYILKALSFSDPRHGWAVGEYGYIYFTADGGKTWKKQAGFFRISSETGVPEGGKILFDVLALDPRTAWAVGIDNHVLRTVDGGKSWNDLSLKGIKTQLYCIESDKKGHVVLGGRGLFMESRDNGSTWQAPQFEPTITYGWIYALAHLKNSYYVAAGWNGAIYRATSNSWQRIKY